MQDEIDIASAIDMLIACRAKQARLQLDTIFAVKAAAKARLQATWDPYFDIKKELGQLSLI